MSIPAERWADLIPHRGSMRLVETVEQWDERHVVCTAMTHHRPDHPLRGPSGLHAIHALEYAAQAMAIHTGLTGRHGTSIKTGMVAALRQVRVNETWLDRIPAPLRIRADLVAGGGREAMYRFEVVAEGRVIMDGRALVVVGDELEVTESCGKE